VRPPFTGIASESFHSGCASALKIGKFVMVGVVLTLALSFVLLFQLTDLGSLSTFPRTNQSPTLNQSSSLDNGGVLASPSLGSSLDGAMNGGSVLMYPNPDTGNITVLGTIGTYTLAPACSLSSPPCAITQTTIYYVTVNGRNYRLLFQNRTSVPDLLLGSSAVVTGSYVTPSTFKANEWTPVLYFYGDIYVKLITYYHILPR